MTNTNTVGTLQDILEKARIVSASGNSNQVTDVKLMKYLNAFYTLDLPQDLRILKLKDTYRFFTQRGIDTYPFNYDLYTSCEPPAYCAKQQMTVYQDPSTFTGSSFNLQNIVTLTQGSGIAGPYTGTISSTPILRSVNNNPLSSSYPAARVTNILITANVALGVTENVTDDGNGNLIDPDTGVNRGTINYESGLITNLIFSQSIPSGENIYVESKQIVYGQPFTIMFFQEQFTVRPIPDKGYTIEIVAYRNPSQALMGTNSTSTPQLLGRPEMFVWWELLAFGIAKKLYQDRLDDDGVARMQSYIEEKISEARTQSYSQLGKQRAGTIFAEQLVQQPNYGWGIFGNGQS